jgi:hypothetical protein
MDLLDSTAVAMLAGCALLLLTGLWTRRRARGNPAMSDPLERDTVRDWPPQAVRILTLPERRAYELMRRAFPRRLILAQVPLARFISVPPQQSYREWLSRVGRQHVDLVLCDSSSRVIAAVEIRSPMASDRSIERHDRVAEVLTAAGIPVTVWREDALPEPAQVRELLRRNTLDVDDEFDARGPLPLPEIHELLAEGDEQAFQGGSDPVASTFFASLDGPIERSATSA